MCMKMVDRRTLRLMPHDVLQLAGHNYLPHSQAVSGSGWSGNGVDAGLVSYGSDGEAYHESQNDNTWTAKSCAQTWNGAGSIWTTYSGLTALNLSSWTSLLFGIHVGRAQADDSILTVALGYCSSTGTNKQLRRTWTVKSGQIVWFAMNVSDIVTILPSAMNFYATVTPSVVGADWWAQDAFLIQNPASLLRLPEPFVFVRTDGSEISYATDVVHRATLKTCPRCREKIFGYATPPPRTPEPEGPIDYFTLEEL